MATALTDPSARRRPALLHSALLDPRPREVASAEPIAGSVPIPLDELPARVHELPPRHHELLVVACAECDAALAWLHGVGRSGQRAAPRGDVRPTDALITWRLWRPTEFLTCVAPWIRPGRALELACGAGRDAVFLASLGWSVVAVDHLPDALDRGRDLARRYLPPDAAARIEWRRDDIEADAFAPGAPYELVTGFRFLHRPLLPKLGDWLAPGGVLLWETFTTEHRARFGKPSSDAHVLRASELLGLVGPLPVVHHSERDRGQAHTARLLARRL